MYLHAFRGNTACSTSSSNGLSCKHNFNIQSCPSLEQDLMLLVFLANLYLGTSL